MLTKTTKRVILPIEGMTCAACVSHVEGVSQVMVNLATEQATVDYNPALAAAAMTASSVTVVSNSLRLQRFKGSKA